MDKIDVYFLHLSDGWSSVWAVIQKQNLLHSYCALPDKIYVGRKIMLCLWKLYPIANILDYCPFAAGS